VLVPEHILPESSVITAKTKMIKVCYIRSCNILYDSSSWWCNVIYQWLPNVSLDVCLENAALYKSYCIYTKTALLKITVKVCRDMFCTCKCYLIGVMKQFQISWLIQSRQKKTWLTSHISM
jgi:hypothetical protein